MNLIVDARFPEEKSPVKIVGLTRTSNSAQSLETLIPLLSEALKGRATEAFIFGSTARRQNTPLSDLDLLIVCDSARKFINRYLDFEDLFEQIPNLELHVYTPTEIEKMQENPFIREIKKDWMQIPL